MLQKYFKIKINPISKWHRFILQNKQPLLFLTSLLPDIVDTKYLNWMSNQKVLQSIFIDSLLWNIMI